MYWRRIAISSIPINDSKEFENWLLTQWRIKDDLLENYIQNGHFPADKETDYIEAQVKLKYWFEIGQPFEILAIPVGFIATRIFSKLYK